MDDTKIFNVTIIDHNGTNFIVDVPSTWTEVEDAHDALRIVRTKVINSEPIDCLRITEGHYNNEKETVMFLTAVRLSIKREVS